MGLIYDLSQKYKTLSIVGMSKNAGKTTALNYLIEEAMDEGVRLGITSTGRDGETEDLVTGTEKPRVYLDEDTLVAVPSFLYDMSDAGLEVVKETKYSTAIGTLLICRVKSAGYVQVAGPVINAEQKLLCQDMLNEGCDMVLIDGAIDRKTIASPDTSDAIILATGAVISRKMNKVVEETAHVVNLYSIDELEDGIYRDAIESYKHEDKIMTISKSGEVKKLDLLTGLGAARHIDEAIEEDTGVVFIPGGLVVGRVGFHTDGDLIGVDHEVGAGLFVVINGRRGGDAGKSIVNTRIGVAIGCASGDSRDATCVCSALVCIY